LTTRGGHAVNRETGVDEADIAANFRLPIAPSVPTLMRQFSWS